LGSGAEIGLVTDAARADRSAGAEPVWHSAGPPSNKPNKVEQQIERKLIERPHPFSFAQGKPVFTNPPKKQPNFAWHGNVFAKTSESQRKLSIEEIQIL